MDGGLQLLQCRLDVARCFPMVHADVCDSGDVIWIKGTSARSKVGEKEEISARTSLRKHARHWVPGRSC